MIVPFVITRSLCVKPTTGLLKVTVKVIGVVGMTTSLGVIVAIGPVRSDVMDALTGSFVFPAASETANEGTETETRPSVVEVTVKLYDVPEPVSVPILPFVTVISELVNPFTNSLKVKVKVMGLALVMPEFGAMVNTGLVTS